MSLFETKTGLRASNDVWMNTKEAANYLSCHPNTLEKMRSRGEGPAYSKLGAKSVRYHKTALDTFMKGGRDEL